MTTKTKKTLALIDDLAGVPDQRASQPRVVVPVDAFRLFIGCHNNHREQKRPAAGLIFQLNYHYS